MYDDMIVRSSAPPDLQTITPQASKALSEKGQISPVLLWECEHCSEIFATLEETEVHEFKVHGIEPDGMASGGGVVRGPGRATQ
jgi:hypothetical protein